MVSINKPSILMDNINYTLKIMKILKFKNTVAEIICQIASTATGDVK